MARQCIQQKRTRNVVWFKEKAMLAETQEAGQILDDDQLEFLVDPCILDGQIAQTTILNTATFQTEDLDAYDSDCDDVSNAKAVLMANLSNYGSDVISEVPHSDSYHNDMDNQKEVSQSKMLAKQNDPNSKEKKVNTTPINYVELNRLSEDFGYPFVPQQELSDKQAFWLQTLHSKTDQSASSPIKIEAPQELPKCVDLDAEILNKQNAYNDLSKSYSQLEKHCISLELTMQLNQEIFQKNPLINNQNALEIPEYFKNNNLKAQLQAKDTTILKCSTSTYRS
nr:hypothetical protein [Tanacetum cinerariifolium]